MKRQNERGLTLIELLAALAISSIILIVAYSILSTMIKSNDRSSTQITIQNESVIISQKIENLMPNIDSVQIPNDVNVDANGGFKKFIAIDKRKIESSPGVFNDIDPPITTLIEINNRNLLINNQKVNSDNYSLENTTFKLLNKTTLQVYYELINLKRNVEISLYKVYTLQGG
jgi:prepilin-type N-terminal cleavage/methylation domain-containing protein